MVENHCPRPLPLAMSMYIENPTYPQFRILSQLKRWVVPGWCSPMMLEAPGGQLEDILEVLEKISPMCLIYLRYNQTKYLTKLNLAVGHPNPNRLEIEKTKAQKECLRLLVRNIVTSL